MSILTDKNGNPMEAAEGSAESKPNGVPKKQDSTDIRTVPTGTLIYNLILVANQEMGARAMLAQLERMKVEQKVVGEVPQMQHIAAEYAMLEQHRFIMASEINARFADMDKMFAARRGVEIWEPGELSSTPPGGGSEPS